MGRLFWATHLLLGTREDGVYSDTQQPRIQYQYACETSILKLKVAQEGHEPTCPKCSKAWGKAQLAKLKEDGKTITTERVEGSHYKSMYKVFLNGDLVGYVVFPNGFGMDWRVHPLRLKNDLIEAEADHYPKKHTELAVAQDCHSLEGALSKTPKLVEQGKLISEAQLRAKHARGQEEAGRWLEERRQKRAAEKAALDEILEGLKSILDRTDHGLTNFERNAVGAAYESLKPTET
jgi:hypothetical protein